MIKVADNIWIGNAIDCEAVSLHEISAILNVAQDLQGKRGWPDVEYMQVGLIDGPGNPDSVYPAAVLALTALLKRHTVLVCCHEGSRSLAVVIMYMESLFKRGWGTWVEVLTERVNTDLPVPHKVHKAAFDRINWEALRKLAGVKS